MHPKGTFFPAGAVLGIISAGPEDAAGRVCQSASCCQSRTGLKVESKSNQSRNAPKVEEVSPAEKSNDFARKNLRQSRIGFELCTFVSWFRYIPRIFAHFACRFVSRDVFGGGIIIRVQGSFLWWRQVVRVIPCFIFLFWGLIPTLFWLKPSFWG